MRRRQFLSLTAAAAAFPHVAFAQQAAKVPRIAWLYPGPPTNFITDYLEPGLADLGFLSGRDLTIEEYWVPTVADLPDYAARIVATKPDVIVTASAAAALALKHATVTIPIVVSDMSDPVALGLVSSLAHPGGNITGFGSSTADLATRQLALLKELVPSLGRFAVPYFPASPNTTLYLPQLKSGAAELRMEPVLVELTQGQDYRPQFDRVFATGSPAVLQLQYGEIFNASAYDLMYDLYLQHRMPVLAGNSLNPGWATPMYGLVHYFSDVVEIRRGRLPATVVAVLKGARPADIPVELPTKFDLVVNTWMAKTIGITVPASILAQATQVIDYDIRAPKGAN